MIGGQRMAGLERLGGWGEDFVAAAVPLRAPLDHQAFGEIEPRPLDEKRQCGVDVGRGERVGEGRIERVDVLEIGQMREVLAQHLSVEPLLEQPPAQRPGLRALAKRFERPDLQAAAPLRRRIVRREPDVKVGHREHIDRQPSRAAAASRAPRRRGRRR